MFKFTHGDDRMITILHNCEGHCRKLQFYGNPIEFEEKYLENNGDFTKIWMGEKNMGDFEIAHNAETSVRRYDYIIDGSENNTLHRITDEGVLIPVGLMKPDTPEIILHYVWCGMNGIMFPKTPPHWADVGEEEYDPEMVKEIAFEAIMEFKSIVKEKKAPKWSVKSPLYGERDITEFNRVMNEILTIPFFKAGYYIEHGKYPDIEDWEDTLFAFQLGMVIGIEPYRFTCQGHEKLFPEIM